VAREQRTRADRLESEKNELTHKVGSLESEKARLYRELKQEKTWLQESQLECEMLKD
jgi:hypothetical protein